MSCILLSTLEHLAAAFLFFAGLNWIHLPLKSPERPTEEEVLK
jgi:hypothetical protein